MSLFSASVCYQRLQRFYNFATISNLWVALTEHWDLNDLQIKPPYFILNSNYVLLKCQRSAYNSTHLRDLLSQLSYLTINCFIAA